MCSLTKKKKKTLYKLTYPTSSEFVVIFKFLKQWQNDFILQIFLSNEVKIKSILTRVLEAEYIIIPSVLMNRPRT